MRIFHVVKIFVLCNGPRGGNKIDVHPLYSYRLQHAFEIVLSTYEEKVVGNEIVWLGYIIEKIRMLDFVLCNRPTPRGRNENDVHPSLSYTACICRVTYGRKSKKIAVHKQTPNTQMHHFQNQNISSVQGDSNETVVHPFVFMHTTK